MLLASYVLTVDPGVRAMGVCLWDKRKWDDPTGGLERAAVFHTKAKDWSIAVQDLINQMHGQFDIYRIKSVYCEIPILFVGGKGHAAAASGDLVHLAFSTGMIAAWAFNRNAQFNPVESGTWNGQIPKPIIQKRIRMTGLHTKLSQNQSHDWDACGIGLYVKKHPMFVS